MIEGSKKHLEEAKETYFEHMWNAFKISFAMIGSGLKAVVHAFIPALFSTAASDRIKKLYKFIEDRGEKN